jgi:AraC family transcriptional regulator
MLQDGHDGSRFTEERSDRPHPATSETCHLPDTGVLARWQVVRLRRHVDRHLDSKLSQDLLAREVRLSISHFARTFRRSFGCTPHRYITAQRMKRARALLRSSPRPLSEIALTCGLSDQAHLSRLFKQDTGLTPTQWRRQHAEFD